MGAPPDLLVKPSELSRFNVPSAFLAQFVPKPFLVQVVTAGALGVMSFQWQLVGDPSWSAAIVSTAGSSWLNTVDDAFADLTIAAASYGAGDTYLVDTAGVVTPQGGAPAGRLSAVLWDLRQSACSAATAEAMTLMRDAIRPPLLTWGDDAKMHAAAMAFEILKRGKGLTANQAGVGDENVLKGGEVARAFFKGIGENGKPDSMTDTSSSSDGPLIAVYPYGDTPRGW